MASKRLEKIKSARSISDVLDVLSEIAYEFKNSSAIVKRLVSSLSAEIVMDVRKSQPTNKMKVTDTTYVAPKLTELKVHVDVVNRLYDNVLELDAAEALVKQAFAGHKKQKAALAAIKDLKADIDNSINDALDALADIAKKHMPSKMTQFVDKVTSDLIDRLPNKSYKNIFRQVYVTPDATDKTLIHFCDYIGIEGLKNIQGFTYDQYYVIVTGVVNKSGSMTIYLNGLPDFKVPGKYPLGKEVADIAAAKRQLVLLLDHNNFVVDQEKMPFPIDADRANTAGFTNIRGVESVKVDNDEMTVILSPNVKTDRTRDSVRIEVQALLNSIVGAKRNSSIFEHKFGTRSGKQAIKFILVPNLDKKAGFSLQHLREASELLGLSERQEAALRFALQH